MKNHHQWFSRNDSLNNHPEEVPLLRMARALLHPSLVPRNAVCSISFVMPTKSSSGLLVFRAVAVTVISNNGGVDTRLPMNIKWRRCIVNINLCHEFVPSLCEQMPQKVHPQHSVILAVPKSSLLHICVIHSQHKNRDRREGPRQLDVQGQISCCVFCAIEYT